MRLSQLIEQASPTRMTALKLQQQLLDESDGLLDIELSPIEIPGAEGVKLLITSPFGKVIAKAIPLNDEFAIAVWLTDQISKVRFFETDDAGMSQAVVLIIRQVLGSTWTMDQRIVTELFKELRDQKRGLRANGVWYKLKRRTPHPELTVGKLYLVTQKGSMYYCSLVKFESNTVKGQNGRIVQHATWSNILTKQPWKWPEMGIAMFFELEPLG